MADCLIKGIMLIYPTEFQRGPLTGAGLDSGCARGIILG